LDFPFGEAGRRLAGVVRFSRCHVPAGRRLAPRVPGAAGSGWGQRPRARTAGPPDAAGANRGPRACPQKGGTPAESAGGSDAASEELSGLGSFLVGVRARWVPCDSRRLSPGTNRYGLLLVASARSCTARPGSRGSRAHADLSSAGLLAAPGTHRGGLGGGG